MSIVLALVFIMTSLPINASVQTFSEPLIDQIQNFNEENNVELDSDNASEVKSAQAETQEMLSVNDRENLVVSENVSSIYNYEEEILETTPVLNNSALEKESSVSKEQKNRSKTVKREFAKIKKLLENTGFYPGEYDWFAEDFSNTETDAEYYEDTEDVYVEETDEISEELTDDVSDDIEEDEQPSEESEESFEEIISNEDETGEVPVMFSMRSSIASAEDVTASTSGSAVAEDVGETVISGGATAVVPGGASSENVTGGETDEEEDESITFPDESYTVLGSVTLPSNAIISAGDIMNIFAYKAPVVENGRVIKSDYACWNRTITLAAGQKDVSFSVSLPADNYIFGVHFLSGNKSISNLRYYYTEDGLTLNKYVADVVTLLSDKSNIDMEVPVAESYISGTIDLSNCIPTEAGYIYVDAWPMYGNSYYALIDVPSGATSVDYEIGLSFGTYELYFESDFFFSGSYYSGSLSSGNKGRSSSFILVEEGIDNLDITVPLPEEDEDDDSDDSYDEYSVTVNFEEALDVDKTYVIALFCDDGWYMEEYDRSYVYASEGDTYVTAELGIRSSLDDASLYVAYKEVPENSDIVMYDTDLAYIYYSETYGTVSDRDDATDVYGDYNIVINEPEAIVLEGNIVYDNGIALTGYAYVGADFGDGIFYDLVELPCENFAINVPERYVGQQFEMFFAKEQDGSFNEETIVYDGEIYVFQESMDIDVSAGKFYIQEGTITLPLPAPSNGAVVSVDSNSVSEEYVIMPDERSLEYELVMPAYLTGTNMYAHLITYEPFNSTYDTNVGKAYDIAFEETVNVSGTVSLPEDVTFDKDISFEVCLEGDTYEYQYVSILAGQKETKYSIKYPKNSGLYNVSVYIMDDEVPLSRYQEECSFVASEDMIIDIQLEKAKTISGTITLPEDMVYDGENVEYYIFAECESGRYQCYYETSTPGEENEFTIILDAEDDEYIVGVYVYSLENTTCIGTDVNAYYVSDNNMTLDYSEASYVEADSVCNLYFPLNKTVSGSVSFTEDAFADGELCARIYIESEYGERIHKEIEEISISDGFDYSVYVPVHWKWAGIGLGIWENDQNGTAAGSDADNWTPVKTNISLAEYIYDYETGGFIYTGYTPAMVELDEDLDIPEFTVPKATKVTGKVIFPQDFKSTDKVEYIDLNFETITSTGRSWGETGFLDKDNNFEAYLPYFIGGEYNVSAYKPWSVGSNILEGHYYYQDEEGFISVNIIPGTDVTGIEIEYETGYAISGTVSLPQDAVISDTTSVNVNVRYGDSNGNVYLNNETRSGDYIIAVRKDGEHEEPITVSIYANSTVQGAGPDTNICTGEFFVAADGSLVSNEENAEAISLTSDITKDFALTTGIPVTVNINRPSSSYSFINGEVRLEYQGEEEEDCFYTNEWFSMPEDTKNYSTNIVVPKELADEKFYVSYYVYSGDVYTSGNVWVNPDGSYSKTLAGAEAHQINNPISITLGTQSQLAKTIQGTISFEEGCELPRGSYTLYVYAYNTSYGNTVSEYININSVKDYDYKIILPDYYGDYRVYVNLYSGDSNVFSGTLYYTTTGGTVNQSEATLVAADSTDINFVIPKLSEVSGKIVVDEDYKYLEELDRVNVIFRRQSDYGERGVTAFVDEDMNYKAYLPYDFAGNCKVGIKILGDGPMNNLVKGYTYWTEDWHALNNGTDAEDVDVAVETGFTLSGTVKLPEGTELEENLYYSLNYDDSYANLWFDSETSEAEFMFGTPKDSYNSNYFDGDGSYSGETPVNVYLDYAMYSEDGTVYYDWDSDLNFMVREDIEDIEITIPKGVVVNFPLSGGPASGDHYGELMIEEIEGEFTKTLGVSCYSGKENEWVVFPETYKGKAVTIAYTSTANSESDYYIPWRVYLGSGDKFYGDSDNSRAFVIAEENSIPLVLPKASDVIYPEYVLQSEHPYQRSMNKVYTYTYDGEADSLMITFSDNTEVERSYDYIYIIDENGNETQYTGTMLSGSVITVPGDSFSIRLTSDGSAQKFGFAITEVRPVVTHNVTFKNYDGTVLETSVVLDKQDAVYNGLTPEKPADGIKKYRFIGWDKELIGITEDTEFIAQFEEVIIYLESDHPYSNYTDLTYTYKYTEDETVDALRVTFSEKTETENYYDRIYVYDQYGEQIASYTGTIGAQSVVVPGNSFSIRLTSDGSSTAYGFEVVGVAPVKENYTVTFKNYDGTVLSTVSVPAGGTAVYDGETPVREDENYEYEFTGWNKSLTYVYQDMVVTAQFTRIYYVNVNYYNYDGTLLYTDKVRGGNKSEYSGAVPYKPAGDDGIGYVFTGWDKTLDSVYYDTSVTALFARKSIKKISTEAELRAIADDLDGVYVLENDIELTSAWEPVGVSGAPFSGVFDGNGHSIKNITFDIGSYNNVGFFIDVENAVLRNMNLETEISTNYSIYNVVIAPLATTARGCDIRNVHVKGSIDVQTDSNSSVSGFVDGLLDCYVDSSSVNVDITSSGYMAGFSEAVSNTKISNSYYKGTITPGYAEDIAGFANVEYYGETSFDACFSNTSFDISDGSTVNYATPFVAVYDETDETEITANNCYYNQDTFTVEAQYENEDAIFLGTGLTDEEMKSADSFVGFDFGMIWEMDENGNLTLSSAGGKICSEHKFSEWNKVSEVTCTTDGLETRTCSRCGRVEKNITKAEGHTFGEWEIIEEADVLSEGLMTRECSVCYETETEEIEKIEVELNDPNYGLVHFEIVDAITLEPINNAQLFISTDNDGENTFYTDEEGKIAQALPIGVVNVSVYKSGYLTRTVKINVVSGEQNVPVIGISTKPLVEAKLSSKVMTYDEIINAGIDVTAPGNNHVVKYNVTLTFGGREKADIVTYFNDNHSCVGNVRIPVHLSTGTVYVYPVSETFYLMVYGEVQWLKEMFDVEMLIMNNSNTDTVTECTAELVLPDGLSLAEMKEEQQTLIQKVDDIGHSESRSVHWYVRGDVAGEYNIGANLNAVLSPLGDIIDQKYTLEEPIKVYAGNAMHMDIYVPDMTFYGDRYPIKIELTNVSDRTLYNVSNTIKYFKEGKVTHYSNGAFVSETYFTEDDIASIGASEFKPGDKISIEVQADIEFRTSLIRAGLDEIKKYVGNIDNLLVAYEAYITGAKKVNDSYIALRDMVDSISNIITKKAYEGTDAEVAGNLLNAVNAFAELVKVAESQKSVNLFNKLKTTGVYKVLSEICEKNDVFATYRANRITKYVNTITAIVNSENIVVENAVSEEMLFELLRRAIESIPIKYYLEDVLVSTLEGSTTSIPYTIHRLTPEERFSSISRLDSYLNSVIETAMGHIDSPWIMNILSDGNAAYEDSEDVVFVNGTSNKFAASDNMGDVEFKAWASIASPALEITSTNENAVIEDGVLKFVGPGYISVKALETGNGTLYIQMGDEIKEYNFTVVDAHTCESADAVTIISPDTDVDGYMISLCDICHSIMSVDKHESACENHIYGEYIVEIDANGEELGIKHRVCKECGHIQYLVIDESIDYMEFILTPESKLDITEKQTGDGSYLKQVVAGMTAEQITSHFDNTNVEVVLANGTAVSAGSKLGTGSKLIIKNQDEAISSELTVVVKGDTTGDGNFNILDMIKVFNHVADEETKSLDGEYAEAAYVNSDTRINILDLILMFNAIKNGEVLR